MLFCFGLFALLLYNTVVANAECSYTYRNSSQQHIEAQSTDYEKKGFRRCEFLIQLGDPQQQIELNFTRLSGFGAHNASDHGRQEGPNQEKEKEEEEESRNPGSSGEGGGGGGPQEGDLQAGGEGSRTSEHGEPNPTTTVTHTVVLDSKLSSIVSSPVPPRQQPQQHSPTHNTHAYAKTNTSSDTVAEAPSQRPPTWPPTWVAGQSQGGGEAPESGPCLPMVEIREVTGEGQERTRHRICREHHNTKTPVVFHYASSVRIVYEWKQKQSSGFTLYFDFSSSEYEKCVHKCDGSRCLTEAGLLCDGHPDCLDRSDEGSPACPLSTSGVTPDPLDAGHLVQIVVIPTSVLVVGVVVCVVCLLVRHHHHHHHHHHRWATGGGGAPSSSTSPSDMQPHHLHHHHHQLRGNGHATAVHLDCPQSQSSEGLTPSGCSSQECSNEQAVALLPSGNGSQQQRFHHKHSPWHPPLPVLPGTQHPHHHPSTTTPLDPEVIGLPPNIPVSPDGEEGYSASQLRLLDRRFRVANSSELFKPPPNKTVFDRESPPPYSLTPSPGTGLYGAGGGSSSPSTTSPLAPPPSPPASLGRGEGYLSPGGVRAERVIRDSEGQPVVSRCYTMFSGPARPSRGDPPLIPRLSAAPSRRSPRHQLLSSVSSPTPSSGCPDGTRQGASASSSRDCDRGPPRRPSPPRVHGALLAAGDMLLPSPRSPLPASSGPPGGPLPPPPAPLRSMPSQTASSSLPGWSSSPSTSLVVVAVSPGDRDRRDNFGGVPEDDPPSETPSRGSPPSYQTCSART